MNRSLVDSLQLFVGATPSQSLGNWRLLERHFMEWDESAFREFVPVCVAGWEGVPDRLVSHAESVALDPGLGLAAEAARLAECTGLTDEASWEAVASWACALAITTFDDALEAMPKPAHRQTSRGSGADGVPELRADSEDGDSSADAPHDDGLLLHNDLALKVERLEQENIQLLAELSFMRDQARSPQSAAGETLADQSPHLPRFDQQPEPTTVAHFQEVAMLLDDQVRETHSISAISHVSVADYRGNLVELVRSQRERLSQIELHLARITSDLGPAIPETAPVEISWMRVAVAKDLEWDRRHQFPVDADDFRLWAANL